MENLTINEEYLRLMLKPLDNLPYFNHIPREKLSLNIPKTSGVYILTDENMKVLYIGKSKQLRSRIQSHTSFGCVESSWVDKNRIKRIYIIVCPEGINDIVEIAYQYFLESEFNNKGHATDYKNTRKNYFDIFNKDIKEE
jgi:hypothetical protein